MMVGNDEWAGSMASGAGEVVREVLIRAEQVPEGQVVAMDAVFGPDSANVLLFRDREGLRAWHNACPHAGRRLDYAPGRFLLNQGRLICAAHGAAMQLSDGRCVEGPGRGGGLAALPVRAVAEGWWLREA
jgi:nitrite reductase/ring-hydroxylating ferredoxin subunit